MVLATNDLLCHLCLRLYGHLVTVGSNGAEVKRNARICV